MSSLLAVVLYLLLIYLLGYLLLSLFAKPSQMALSSMCPLSFGLGAGGVSLLLFWASLLGIKPQRTLLFIIFIVTVTLLAFLRKKRVLLKPIFPKSRWEFISAYLLAFLLLIPCLYVAVGTIGLPLHNIDTLAIWGLKSKVLYANSIMNSSYFYDLSKSYSHLDYPLLLPFLTAGMYAATGSMKEAAGNTLHLFFFISFILLIYSALRKILSHNQSLVLVLIYFLNVPLLLHSMSGLADLILMFYYVGSVFFLISWIESNKKSDLFVAIFMNILLLFTKNEGFALAFINLVVICVWTIWNKKWERFKGLGTYASIFLGINLPWLIFRATIPKTHENYLGQLKLSIFIENLDRIPSIISAFITSIFNIHIWGGLWILLFVSAVVGYTANRLLAAKLLWTLLLLHLATYFLIFIITPWNVYELLSFKTYPLLLQASPLTLFLIAQYWNSTALKAPWR